jgi:hypothetical protein
MPRRVLLGHLHCDRADRTSSVMGRESEAMMMVTVTARIVACVLDSQSVTPLTETNEIIQ